MPEPIRKWLDDFAAWAEGVLKDAVLSSHLKEAKDRKSAQIAALKRMIELMKGIAG